MLLHGTGELLATTAYLFIMGAVIANTNNLTYAAITTSRILLVTITDAFFYATTVYVSMRSTAGQGGYLNPAVALSICTMQVIYTSKSRFRIKLFIRCLLLIIMQIVGALAAALLLYLSVPNVSDGAEKLSLPVISLGQGPAAAFVLQTMVSMILVFTILSVRLNEPRRSSLMVGLAMFVVKAVSFPLTGGCVNPARYLGSAIFSMDLTNMWIHVFSPIVGGLIATGFFVLFRDADITPE